VFVQSSDGMNRYIGRIIGGAAFAAAAALTLLPASCRSVRISAERRAQIIQGMDTADMVTYEFPDGDIVIARDHEIFSFTTTGIRLALDASATTKPIGDPDGRLIFRDRKGRVTLALDQQDPFIVIGGYCYRTGKESLPGKAYFELTYHPAEERQGNALFENKKKHGRWTYYYNDGSRMSELEYREGKQLGDWIVWNRDGSILYKGKFTDPPKNE
jgi:hypothetical protein